MKQKDFALILVVGFVSAVLSLLLSNVLIGSPASKQQKAEVVEKISADFTEPNPKYFNSNSIDPTKLIRIGENPNTNPFGDEQ